MPPKIKIPAEIKMPAEVKSMLEAKQEQIEALFGSDVCQQLLSGKCPPGITRRVATDPIKARHLVTTALLS